MNNGEFLNEERYLESKKKISKIALIVLIIGVLAGLSLIAVGLIKQNKINSKYSDSVKTSLSEQIETEKQVLIKTQAELEAKIKPVEDEIKSLEREKFTGFDDDYYARQDRIEELEKSISSDRKTASLIISIVNNSDFACKFDGATNTITSKYCSLVTQLNEINNDSNKSRDSHNSIPFYMFGAFIIIATCMISGSIFIFTKRREILAFQTQQVMPVAQEGITKMAPTIGKAGASIAKEMAPVYGETAKEIAKGIKEGLKDDEKR